MYIANSLMEGLRILGFDKETIKTVSKEKSLEEIFLSTLFLNYLLVLIVYLIGIVIGGFSINGKELNMSVFFGLLMVYPFIYNLIVYLVYWFFGFTAEMLNSKNHIKPLISVGFHTAIVYSVLIYIIALLSTFNLAYGGFLLTVFLLYFLYTMFLSISTIYDYSLGQVLMIIFIPFLVLSALVMFILLVYPDFVRTLLGVILS